MTVKESDLHESVEDEAQAAEPEISDAVATSPPELENEKKPEDDKPARRLSITLRSLLVVVIIAALLGAVGVLSWLYLGARHTLSSQTEHATNDTHAEQVALNYAVNAAEMNYGDLDGWKTKLVAGTSQELNAKLTKAAGEMEQILVPLQWASTAKPLAAKIRSDSDGIYIVDCFVSVFTKTAQSPDPLQSTATYSITLDQGKGWQITDVGGVGATLAQK
jgi:Mce-associated membrane protein